MPNKINFEATILYFEAVLGLEIYFQEMLDWGQMVEGEALAELMGCKAGALPASYLDLPLPVGVLSKSL